MSETPETTPATPAESDGADFFNRRAAVLIACVAVFAAIITSLQTYAGAQSAQANRDAQRYAIQAMGQKTSGQAQVSYDRQSALQTWEELSDLAIASDTNRDNAAAERYRDVRDRIIKLSPLLSEPYFDTETQSWPNISAYEADVYYVATTELSERYADAAARFDAWGDKANTYVVHLTLLAVALSLFGLSTTISSGARRIFIIAGLGIVGVTLAWAGANYLAPVPHLPDGSITAYARGVGLAYQGETEKAIQAFDEALQHAPDYPNALYQRGNAQYDMGDYEAAVADYVKAQAAGRDDTSVGWNLGWTYYLMGRYEDAKRVDQHVLDLDPSLIGVRLNLGIARLAAGENAAAKIDYEDAMKTAEQIVTDARASDAHPPASLWYYLDAGSVDLQNLIDRLGDQDKDWTQAPPKDKVADPDSVHRIAQDMIEELKSLTTALEYTGQPPQGSVAAKIGAFSFGLATYDANGDFLQYETAAAYPYRTREVLVLFDYEGMQIDQDVIFKVYLNGQEYTPLRQVVKWPESLGESGSAQYPITYAYSRIFFLPAGEYFVEMYVDAHLMQRGRFEVKHAYDLLGGEPGALLFLDDFDDPVSGWQRTQRDDYVTDYDSGIYQITVMTPSLVVQSTPELTFGDVAIDVDAKKASGPDDPNFGVICRFQDNNNYYVLQISGDGYAAIYKLKDSEWTLLSGEELQYSDAILQGDATNHLHAECAGDTLSLYVNDQFLISAQDADFTTGYVGLLAGTYDTPGADIWFDNFTARQPGGAPIESPPSSGPLFQDDFSDPSSGWTRADKDTYITDYANGAYRFYVKPDNYSVWSTAPGVTVDDASIEVEATKTAGPDDANFGIVCRYVDADNFYFLMITSDGYAAIYKLKAGGWTLLSGDELQFSDAILPGDATNVIRADCIGSTVSLTVNGELLMEVEDTDFESGSVGLLAGTNTAGGADIVFDNFIVTQP